MKSRTRVLLLILLMPALSWLLSWLASAALREQEGHRTVAAREVVSAPSLRGMTLFIVAAETNYSETELLRIEAGLGRVRAWSWACLGSGLVVYFWILSAGLASGRQRERLLSLFLPCLYATLAGAAFLSMALALSFGYAAHAFMLFQYGLAATFVPGLFAISGLLAGLIVLWSGFSIFRRQDHLVQACVVSEEEQPALWALVREVSQALKTAAPDNLLLGLEPSFYVTEMDLVCRGRRVTGRSLHLSLAEARLYTPYELRAVIGHEMAHFAGEDTRYSRRFYPIHKGVSSALAYLGSSSNPVIHLAQSPAVSCLRFFLESFLIAERALSRERETAADGAGARVAGRDKLASALVKTHAFDKLCGPALKEALRRYPSRERCPNLALFYLAAARANPVSDVAQLAAERQPHPTDSHPPLADRLASLQLSLEAVLPFASLPGEAQASASHLVRECECLECRLSEELLWPGLPS